MWACADRQILYPRGGLPDPTAVKISILKAEDGLALLTYAGLGELNNTEVSRWVTQTLSGVNVPLNMMIAKIAVATQRNIPPKWQQRFIAVGAGRKHNQGKRLVYRLSKPGKMGVLPLGGRQVRLEYAGSGTPHLKHEQSRIQTLRRLARRFEDGYVSPITVAKQFAQLNIAISGHAGGRENGISPDCLVAYLANDNSKAQDWAFDAKGRVANLPYLIPSIANGWVYSESMAAMIPYIISGAPIPAEAVINMFMMGLKPPDEKFH